MAVFQRLSSFAIAILLHSTDFVNCKD